ncbi:MAG: 16S rRNA (cytosine(1402)-N(4))-methyltransferase, partial [Lentisphaeria bacterium]|nr:16S rRNA (cytosine(1402)-N(4))-methyltransferase [Lentisphaeria bacterium]
SWKPLLENATKKPVTAGEKELAENPRSACAKLRAAVRTEQPYNNISENQKRENIRAGGGRR